MLSDGQSPQDPANKPTDRRAALLVAAALVAAVLGIAGSATTVAAQPDSVTFSGTITAPGGESTANVVITVVSTCWFQCESTSTALPNDGSERPRPLDPVAFLGEAGVDSSGQWTLTVPASEEGQPLLLVWDRDANLAARFVDGNTHSTLWYWESASEIDIELSAGGRVSGSLADSSGGPPPSGDYGLTTHGVWPSLTIALHVNPQTGRFTSPAVTPGEYRLAHGNHGGGLLGNNDAARVQITAGRTADAGTVQVLKSGEITGTVTDSSGRPLSGIYVTGGVTAQNRYSSMPYSPFSAGATSIWTVTDDDGAYAARNLVPADDWHIEIEIPLPQEFTAIAVGARHFCAIKSDQAITCWGSSQDGQTDAPDGQYSAIAVGAEHSCAIKADQTIACWGDNEYGQTNAPDGQYTAIAAHAGASHSCAIRADGAIACWGNNDDGQTDSPDGQYTAITVGNIHSCAIRADGAIACWGNNDDGQTDSPDGQYTAIAAGRLHSCALKTDNTIACWGAKSGGQANVPSQYTAIATGAAHTCAITTTGTIACWGNNGWGQGVAPAGQFTAVTAAESHSCAIKTDNTIACWGDNEYGQTDAPDGQYTAVAAGNRHSCALKTDNTITCWGNNRDGRSDAPTGQYTAVAAGNRHSCALKTDGNILCWGKNNDGQTDAPDGQYTAIAARWDSSCALGTDRAITCWGNNDHGQTDAPNGQYTAIAAGYVHSCALKTDNTITCWGYNDDGQSDAPDGLYAAIAAGSGHSCALKTDNTIACWGYNVYGQVSNTPVGISVDSIFTAIAAGDSHSCALGTDGNIACWGTNHRGQADVPDGQYTAVAAGDNRSCALKTDNTIACWGQGTYGLTEGPRATYFTASAQDIAIASGETVVCSVDWNTAATGAEVICSGSQPETPDKTVPEDDGVAERCFAVHQFGAQPVDVAKSADRQTVLAQLSWGYHDAIGCYLTLDEAALQTLRAAPAPLGFPAGDPSAAQQCSAVHKFGAQPVDVAKSADRQTVLAQVRWGFHDAIGCYLALDEAATAALRAAHTS